MPFLSGLLFLSLTCGAFAVTGDAIAQFGAVRFTASDLKTFLTTLNPNVRQQALADPRALREMIQLQVIRKAIYNDALAKNWQQKPEIARQIAATREAVVLKTYLTSRVTVPPNFPTEQDIQTAYNLNRDRFMVPRQYHLAQIFIAAGGDFAAARKKVDGLAVKLRANSGNFSSLARQNSQHKTSAQKGGDMGWLAESQIVAGMRAKLTGIARGEISDPIRSDEGWHILRVIDTKPPAPRTLAEVRPTIVASLRQQKQQSEEQLYIARMLQKTPVTLNEPQMRKILADAK